MMKTTMSKMKARRVTVPANEAKQVLSIVPAKLCMWARRPKTTEMAPRTAATGCRTRQ